MRRLPLVLALTIALLVVFALPSGADPGNGNSATELSLNCGADGSVSVLVMFGTSSAVAFAPVGEDDNGRKYALLSIEGKGVAGDELLYEYMHEWGKRNGYRGDVLECDGSHTYDAGPPIGDVTESFNLTLQGKA